MESVSDPASQNVLCPQKQAKKDNLVNQQCEVHLDESASLADAGDARVPFTLARQSPVDIEGQFHAFVSSFLSFCFISHRMRTFFMVKRGADFAGRERGLQPLSRSA
jgi:hypothetical protein